MDLTSIETLNTIAVYLHGAQAITVAALIAWLNQQPTKHNGPFDNGGRFPVYRSIAVWQANHTSPTLARIDDGVYDVRYAILGFFLLSSAFQGIAAAFASGHSGPTLRYIEYSFSASTALCAIAVEAGIHDTYTLQAQFMLTFATMILGIAAEFAQTPQRPLFPCLFFHVAGWCTCLSAYVPALDAFMQTARLSSPGPPNFVKALVIGEFVLFSCFGFVQTYMLAARASAYYYYYACLMMPDSGQQQRYEMPSPPPNSSDNLVDRLREIDERGEWVSIVLSLTAKTMLCWIVMSPLIA